jgi:hypothetical protein
MVVALYQTHRVRLVGCNAAGIATLVVMYPSWFYRGSGPTDCKR